MWIRRPATCTSRRSTGDEGDQDGDGLDVLLVLGVFAVVLVLADLQTAGAGEHYVSSYWIACLKITSPDSPGGVNFLEFL